MTSFIRQFISVAFGQAARMGNGGIFAEIIFFVSAADNRSARFASAFRSRREACNLSS
jgi:hypothetical protein